MTALDLTARWPVPKVSAAVLVGGEVVSTIGDLTRTQRLASLSKPLSAWAALIAIEEGIIALDSPVGQPGCTMRHLLAHAGGYPFDGPDPIAAPERTRIYSNTGFDLLSAAVAKAAGLSFATYLREAVFAPLSMTGHRLVGSAAHGVHGDAAGLIRFVGELHRPMLVSPDTAAQSHRPQYPSLAGIVPGVGRYDRCPWGLGFELRGEKEPHWTGTRNSPATYGHFGGAGTMFWVDPVADVALIALADRPFDTWALSAWPALSDAVLDEFAGVSP